MLKLTTIYGTNKIILKETITKYVSWTNPILMNRWHCLVNASVHSHAVSSYYF